ncbi:peptidase M75 [Psychromicrobium lacuslunae]|uniref:Peptidase M75 n=1 Tax=Psychromicrobium lacuslunae TaxID=1618207 RepID=A0A0D4C337_9MICC|nr:peptidase M75 [Psychromicrobium lacuslunae]
MRSAVITGLGTLTVLALAACGGNSGAATGTTGSSGDAAPVSNGAAQVKVTIQNVDGKAVCVLDHSSAPAGPVSFEVSNKDASGVSEVELLSDKRILGERENVIPGLKPSSFTVTLGGGSYQLYCPGSEPENTAFTVTGSAASAGNSVAEQLKAGTDGYAKYVDGQVDSLVGAVDELKAAIDSGDVNAAQLAYAKARPFYERIEPVAESFPDLDPALDLRIADVQPGTKWTGFHPIEKDIFEAKTITANTKALAAGLVGNIAKLKSLTAGLKYKAEELANGASGLLEEVQSSKITGEEEAYSHIDLVDFVANIEGSQQSFEYLKPALSKIDADLTNTISAKFDEVTKALDGYKDASAIGGYKIYDAALKASDAKKLTQLIQSLQAPLSKIAEKVATA